MPPGWIVPVNSRRRSLRVDFPWSTCATMQKFRNRSIGMAWMRRSRSEITNLLFEAWREREVVKVRICKEERGVRSWEAY